MSDNLEQEDPVKSEDATSYFFCPVCKVLCGSSKGNYLKHLKQHVGDTDSQAWRDHSSKLKSRCGLKRKGRMMPSSAKNKKKSKLDSNVPLPSPSPEVETQSVNEVLDSASSTETSSVSDVAEGFSTDRLIKCLSLSPNYAPKPLVFSPSQNTHPKCGVTQPPKVKHVCSTCLMVFPTQQEMAEHTISHIKNFYKCNKCSRYFRSKEGWLLHMAHHRQENRFRNLRCNNCKVLCFNYTCLKRHVASCVHPGVKVCPTCCVIFSNARAIREHLATRQTDCGDAQVVCDNFSCSKCDWDFWCNSELRAHVLFRVPNVSFKCTLCKARFCLRTHLDDHMLWHNQFKLFKCKYCTALHFKTKALLEKHLSKDHDPLRPYNCPYCEKCFFLPSSLQLHVQDKHKDEKTRQNVTLKNRRPKLKFDDPTSPNAASSKQVEPDLLQLVKETIQVAESGASNSSSLPPELNFLSQALDGDPAKLGLGLIPRRVPLTLNSSKTNLSELAPTTTATTAVEPPATSKRLAETQRKTVTMLVEASLTGEASTSCPELIVPDCAPRSPSPPTIPAPLLTRTYSRASASRTYSKASQGASKTPLTPALAEASQSASKTLLTPALADVGVDDDANHVSRIESPTPPRRQTAVKQTRAIAAVRKLPVVPQPVPEEVAALESKFGAVVFVTLGEDICRQLGFYESSVTAIIQRILSVVDSVSYTEIAPSVTHGTLSLDIYSVMRLLLSDVKTDDALFTPDSIERLLAEMLYVMTQNHELFNA